MERSFFGGSPRALARTAGLFYALTIASGIYAEAIVRGAVVVSGNAVETAANIVAGIVPMRLAAISDLVTVASYLVVTVLLYRLFTRVDGPLSLLAACFSALGIATLAIDLLAHLGATLAAPDAPPIAYFLLKMHDQGYLVADFFFGIYCFMIGALIVRSGFIPSAIGRLMQIAGAFYVADTVIVLLAVPVPDLVMQFMLVPGLIGEAVLTIWLLVIGIDGSKLANES